MNTELLEKYEALKDYLISLGSLAVAFSGGVDSTFLLYAAKDALRDSAVAVTVSSEWFPQRELDEAKSYCDFLDMKHFIINVCEADIEGFAENPPNRCYLCKKAIFSRILETVRDINISNVAEGSNLDDDGDYRPGHIAIKELNVKSPLRKCGFTKQEIRELSRHFNIPTWDKPSFACLASRFPYGEIITSKKLEMVDKAELLLKNMGFNQFRVRHHESVARIELNPDDFPVFMEEANRIKVYEELKKYGFSYVALDILGYRMGSMNEQLETSYEK